MRPRGRRPSVPAAAAVVARSLLVVGSGACMALDSFCGRLLSRPRRGSDDTCAIRPPHGSPLLLLPLLSKRKKVREGESVNVGETKRSRVRERRVRVRSPDVMRAISVIAAYRNSDD